LIHGDFARWNLRFRHGRLTGILDWEFSHLDDLAADFVWSWRGRYTDVIDGYQEVVRLDEHDLALLEPTRRAWILDGAAQVIRTTPPGQTPDLDWVIRLLDREPERF
jgi:aminoglycoside phosphotransferase (APT) family kinase protein